MATVRTAVKDFLATVPEDVKVGVVSFADTSGVDVEPTTDRRGSRLFLHLLDAGVLVGANGLGCLSTPMGEREIDEIAEATARALHVLARGD